MPFLTPIKQRKCIGIIKDFYYYFPLLFSRPVFPEITPG